MEDSMIVKPFEEVYVAPGQSATTSRLSTCLGAGFYSPENRDGYLLHWILGGIIDKGKIFTFRERPSILDAPENYHVLLAGLNADESELSDYILKERKEVVDHLISQGFLEKRIKQFFNEDRESRCCLLMLRKDSAMQRHMKD
ncbi:hypothetical protein GF345_05295 [Candidatus Woesearchaeota archaeon]|nr:hypothetical protein [Candidatus Woesearchaeota archaeon]